jgi:hypothetical protein
MSELNYAIVNLDPCCRPSPNLFALSDLNCASDNDEEDALKKSHANCALVNCASVIAAIKLIKQINDATGGRIAVSFCTR